MHLILQFITKNPSLAEKIIEKKKTSKRCTFKKIYSFAKNSLTFGTVFKIP